MGKVSENRFARADLEHVHLMIDDDMRLEALKQTNYIKAIVTAKGKMDLDMILSSIILNLRQHLPM